MSKQNTTNPSPSSEGLAKNKGDGDVEKSRKMSRRMMNFLFLFAIAEAIFSFVLLLLVIFVPGNPQNTHYLFEICHFTTWIVVLLCFVFGDWTFFLITAILTGVAFLLDLISTVFGIVSLVNCVRTKPKDKACMDNWGWNLAEVVIVFILTVLMFLEVVCSGVLAYKLTPERKNKRTDDKDNSLPLFPSSSSNKKAY